MSADTPHETQRRGTRRSASQAAHVTGEGTKCLCRLRKKSLPGRVGAADREAVTGAQAIVRVEELRVVSDVEPLPVEPVAVDRLALVEPRDEAARLVRRVALVEKAADQRQVLARIEIRRRRRECRGRIVRLLDEEFDSIVVSQLDDAVLRRELEVAAVVDRDGGGRAPTAPISNEVDEAIVEEVVARNDEQIVIDAATFDRELEVTDRTEPIFVGERAIV